MSSPQQPHTPGIPKKTALIAFLTFIIIFGTIFSAGIGYAIATGQMSTSNAKIDNAIRSMFFALPVASKSPEAILLAAVDAHDKVSKHAFSLSLAVDTPYLIAFIGSSKLDARATGAVDYEDREQFLATLDVDIGTQFAGHARLKDYKAYGKIDKLPDFAANFWNITDPRIQDLLKNWFMQDIKPLETEARARNDDKKESTSLTKQYIDKALEYLQDSRIYEEVEVTSDILQKQKMHKISLLASDELIDYLGQKEFDKKKQEYADKHGQERADEIYDSEYYRNRKKPSESVKDVEIHAWFDKKTHLMHKVVVSWRIILSDTYSSYAQAYGDVDPTQRDILVTSVIEFDKFGEEISVETPSEYMPYAEFAQRFKDIQRNIEKGTPLPDESTYGNIDNDPYKSARDAQRLKDATTIQSVVEQYKTDYAQKLPTTSLYIRSLSGSTNCDRSGWLASGLSADDVLCNYFKTTPQDPLNTHGTYSNGKGDLINGPLDYFVVFTPEGEYRICARQESSNNASRLSVDGGLSDDWFEIYSNVNVPRCH